MKPDKLSVAELFQRERRYTVPLYQRAYVWTQDGQWEALWEDIERHADACLRPDAHLSKRAHFLGAIVLNVARIVGSGVARSEVIDGQQRLTTLQVLIAAIRDYAGTYGSKHTSRLTRLTINEDEKLASESAFKVWPTNADRTVFRAVQTAGSPESLLKVLSVGERAAAPRMAAAYLFFYDKVAEYVGESATNEAARDERLFGLLQALRVALQLVVIELEDGDDPQVIFETLNARGQPLLPSDLIRNYLFLQAVNDPDADADELYERYWRDFDVAEADPPVNGEARFWHVDERQGRLTRPRIDLFLFHYLVMKTEQEFSIGQLFKQFRDWHQEAGMSVEALLCDLRAHAAIFETLIRPEGLSRPMVLAQRLKVLDTSTPYPLLMYMLSLPSERLAAADRDQIIVDIESWLVRRFVCWLTNKNYNKFFTALIGKLARAPDDANLVDITRAELTRSNDPTTIWPANESFLSSWLSKPLYAKSRPDRSAMVLRAIELQKRTSRNEANPVPLRLSVEHLLPQKGSLADYPLPIDLPLHSDETPERARERLRDTVGNLTLMTGELNASASNGPWPGKVAKIVEDSDLRLNAWLRSAPPATWDEVSIMARGRDLFGAALAIWPRAGGEPENVDDDELPAGEKGGVAVYRR